MTRPDGGDAVFYRQGVFGDTLGSTCVMMSSIARADNTPTRWLEVTCRARTSATGDCARLEFYFSELVLTD